MVREGLFEKLFAQRSEAGEGGSCAGVCSEKSWAERSGWGVLSGERVDRPWRGVEARVPTSKWTRKRTVEVKSEGAQGDMQPFEDLGSLSKIKTIGSFWAEQGLDWGPPGAGADQLEGCDNNMRQWWQAGPGVLLLWACARRLEVLSQCWMRAAYIDGSQKMVWFGSQNNWISGSEFHVKPRPCSLHLFV